MTKPFRFGVQISNAASAAAWRDKARKLEDLGYSTLFMPDHFGEELAPLPAIAMAAAHTTTLKIGAFVFRQRLQAPGDPRQGVRHHRPPERRPSSSASRGLDEDRLRRAPGLDYDPPAVRRPVRGGAAGHQARRLTGEQFSFTGEHYRITDYASYPKPAQAHLPILVGGGGKRVLSIAAREADIIGINPNLRAGEVGPDATADALQEQTDRKIGWVREAAGSRHDQIEIQMRFFVCKVTDDRMKLAEALAPAFGVEPEEALESGAALVGSESEIIEQLHRRRERWDLSYVVIGDDNVDEFAPIVAKLTGT
jgi:alkanesulfonate monooxygenase SsuD/methylene tetrahydromethanopterin reductase-like flavin-dependent oxidoreductase (luciferase family)